MMRLGRKYVQQQHSTLQYMATNWLAVDGQICPTRQLLCLAQLRLHSVYMDGADLDRGHLSRTVPSALRALETGQLRCLVCRGCICGEGTICPTMEGVPAGWSLDKLSLESPHNLSGPSVWLVDLRITFRVMFILSPDSPSPKSGSLNVKKRSFWLFAPRFTLIIEASSL